MTNTIKIMKKVLTVVLSAAILCASLFVMPLFATAGTTYGEWLAQGIPNGDFEVGVEGAEPYGWSTTSLNYGIDAETASGDVIGFRSDAGAYYDEYSSKFDISTTDDSGNKIATITKKNPGYVALTSVAVPVTPSTAYTLSAMFKELEDNTDYVNNTAGITDANTALVIKEFATNDTTLTTDLSFKKLDSKVNSSEWQSLSGYFTTAETTNYIVVYLCVGSQWNVRNIVGFDNLALEKVGFNGNFDAGESNWTITSMNYDYSGSYNLYPGTYERYFSIGSVVDSGNRVLTLSKNGSGYAAATSSNYEAKASTPYSISVDFKRTAYSETDTSTGNTDFNTALTVAEFNGEGTQVAYHKLANAADSDSWNNFLVHFTTSETTEYFVIYLTVGGQWNIRETLYFDNVEIEEVTLNGDFSAGTIGEAPIHWTDDISMNYAGSTIAGTIFRDPENAWDGNFVPKTALDTDGDKVLALHKTGGGYGAIISAAIPVEPSKSYTVSAIYKHFEVSVDSGSDYGAAIVVGQYADAAAVGNTNCISKTVAQQKTPSYEWVPITATFTTDASTNFIRVYLTLGSAWTHRNIVYFDDLTVTCNTPDVEVPFNGDFELGNDGEDVTSWKKVSMGWNDEGNAYENAYTITNASDNGNQVMAIAKIGAGYIAAKSSEKELRGGTDYKLNFRYKHSSLTSNDNGTAASGNEYYGVSVIIKEFDSNGNQLIRRTLYGPNAAGGTNNFVYGADGIVYNADGTTEFNTDWQDIELNFTTQSDTAYAQVYLWMGAGYKIKTTTYFDDVELTCVYDETDLSFVIMNNVKEDSDILDLVLAKAAADTKAFNAEYDVNMTKSVTFDDVLYIRAKMFDLTTYEQLKEIF